MINVTYLPLKCKNLDYLQEEITTNRSYLVVRCFQKAAKNKQAIILGTSPNCSGTFSHPPTPGSFVVYSHSPHIISIVHLVNHNENGKTVCVSCWSWKRRAFLSYHSVLLLLGGVGGGGVGEVWYFLRLRFVSLYGGRGEGGGHILWDIWGVNCLTLLFWFLLFITWLFLFFG